MAMMLAVLASVVGWFVLVSAFGPMVVPFVFLVGVCVAMVCGFGFEVRR